METRMNKIALKRNKNVKIDVIPGHFATNHSHVNYYINMTDIKCNHTMAHDAAVELAQCLPQGLIVDTIICLEGTEIIGAFLADELTSHGGYKVNEGKSLAVLTPELNANNQMIFRDNTQKMVYEKNVLLLIASVSTGKTINRFTECLQYYSGHLVGIGAIFSAVDQTEDMPINAIFTTKNVEDYTSYLPVDCPLCKNKRKIDALVNSYGYSKI